MRRSVLLVLVVLLHTSCMKWDYGKIEPIDTKDKGLVVVCEGNFQYGNASLSFYDPLSGDVQNEVFYRANGMKLGDVAQSAALQTSSNGTRTLWIVVNNSHVVFAVDPVTFKEKGRIVNLPSPRYIHFVSDTKAYITQLWDNRIIVINPATYEITGYITCPDMTAESGSTEQLVQIGDFVYVNCWSYQSRILKIDTRSDSVVDALEVGIQPNSLVKDCNGKLWTITDGGYEGSPYGYEAPKLHRINPETFAIEKTFTFEMGDAPSEVSITAQGDRLYWINNDIWSISVTADQIPPRPFIHSKGTIYYGLTVSPYNGDVYIADAIDYVQAGKIYRYSSMGDYIDEFYVGIIPGAFCWK